ncbi:fimbria/pilus outer membrane usher protein [Sphingomonas swuensis]|uniref:fimbria/pilus outer membrane usher protein n=1 Tax=Sphingomonas swuensis TaxID=977800 RepID=UPI0031CF5384
MPLATSVDAGPPLGHQPTSPIGLILNGIAQERPGLIAVRGGTLLLAREDLTRLGLLPGDDSGIWIDGKQYMPLAALRGVTATLDEEATTLSLVAAADAFAPARQPQFLATSGMPVSEPVPFVFLGYDLSLARSGGRLLTSGYFDLGVSGRWGVAGTTALLRPGGGALVRLDSSLQRDLPERRLRLVLGDTISRDGDLSSPFRFGGLRIGTDFSLAPDAINYPLPLVSGSALVPSTVELLAASGRQAHLVQPGRFLIEAPPTISGAGEVVMTIADATGTTRQIRQSFYSSPRLLRPGLSEFSLEAGFIRDRYGLRSASYGDAFAAVAGRRGMSGHLTVGGRVEASRSTRRVGISLEAVIASLGEFGLAGAVSQGKGGTGFWWRAQVQRLGPDLSFTASYARRSADYAQVGDIRAFADRQPRHELGASLGLTLPIGELALGFIDARLADGVPYRLGTIGFTATFGDLFLSASVRVSRVGEDADSGFLLSLSRPLGRRASAALTVEKGQWTSSFQQSALGGRGLSFGLASGRGPAGVRVDGYALASNDIGEVEVTAHRSAGSVAARASVRGALVVIGDRLLPTARLHDGLALVDVASDQDVQIFQEGRPVARRARRGRPVLLTGLQPYAGNRVSIRLDDLPLEVALDEAEQLAVPGFRQAAAIRFGRDDAVTPLTLAIVDEQGTPLPPGLEVDVDGVRLGVAGHDGLVFLADARGGAALTVRLPAGSCRANLPVDLATAEARPLRCLAIGAVGAAR